MNSQRPSWVRALLTAGVVLGLVLLVVWLLVAFGFMSVMVDFGS